MMTSDRSCHDDMEWHWKLSWWHGMTLEVVMACHLMQDIPHSPSQRQSFLSFWQSRSRNKLGWRAPVSIHHSSSPWYQLLEMVINLSQLSIPEHTFWRRSSPQQIRQTHFLSDSFVPWIMKYICYHLNESLVTFQHLWGTSDRAPMCCYETEVEIWWLLVSSWSDSGSEEAI